MSERNFNRKKAPTQGNLFAMVLSSEYFESTIYKANTMVDDALAPYVASLSEAMVLTV